MKYRHLFLAVALLICISAIVLVVIKGKPVDKVSFDSVSQIGESIVHHVDKAGKIITAISDEDEIKIGDKMHNDKMQRYLVKNIEGSPLTEYVKNVGLTLVENVKRKNIKYKFHIIDSYCPNAFACPGGHVYITLGLLMEFRSEAELAAILGHEITHVDAKHAIGAVQYKMQIEKITKIVIDDIVDYAYQIIFRPAYSEAQESEADLGGIYLSYRADYHPLAIINAFKNIEKAELSQKKPIYLTPVDDTLNALGGMLERYFSTHPLTADRIDAIKQYVTDNKLTDKNKRYYIGELNYIDKLPKITKMFKEEFSANYPEIKSSNNEEDGNLIIDEEVTEIYTIYGKISIGMTIAEVEKMIPHKSRISKNNEKVDYKNVTIYKFDSKDIRITANISLALENDIVNKIRIIKNKDTV